MLLDWVSPVQTFCNVCDSCIFSGTNWEDVLWKFLAIRNISAEGSGSKWAKIENLEKHFQVYMFFWLQEKQRINFL